MLKRIWLEEFNTFFQIKSKQTGIRQQCWRQRGHIDANHSHIFWTRVKLQPFWDDLSEFWRAS